jgi:hypothetical protein
MTGPDQGALAGRGHLRAAQADREQAITVLKAAYAQGRLTKDELEVRAGQAFASRTYAELAALTADIPADSPTASPAATGPSASAGPSAAAWPPPSTPARTMAKAAGRSGVCLLAAVALAEGAFLAGNFLLIVAAFFALMAASGFFGYGILDAWRERRSRGQQPTGPGQGHQGSEGHRPGDDAAPTGISPARADPTRADRTRADRTRADRTRADRTRADRTRADRTRADSGAWRPGWGRGRPSRRGIPVPVRPLRNAACGAGCAP